MSDNEGVHITHCCKRHGCKYSYEEELCPVEEGTATQEFPCESCTDEPHIMIRSYHHWMGSSKVPDDLKFLVNSICDGWFLPMGLLRKLMEKFDVQLFHTKDGLNLMLDDSGRRHRQR